MISPCMELALPDAKNSVKSAISSGLLQRPIGVSWATQSANPPGSKSLAVMAVLTAPGAIPKI